eukprot:TRINITY_DN8026_c0_g1_i1.p1 TRINITY_DN8026_c0_g1~~TRINITY_DN8026_c0_g1_i1.p1  ORF type:complete len:397 (+),score=69.36 TRINITY_DN8026_c0_g1_i1:38-1192(+)
MEAVKRWWLCRRQRQRRLVLVQVVARHGVRTPIVPPLPPPYGAAAGSTKQYCYEVPECLGPAVPVFSYQDSQTMWRAYHDPEDQPIAATPTPGALTVKGAEQMTALGKWLRKTYVEDCGLLPAVFDPTLVYIRSSWYDRTIHTAKAVLRGLYPSQYRGVGHKLVPIALYDNGTENMNQRSSCPKYAEMQRCLRRSTEFRQLFLPLWQKLKLQGSPAHDAFLEFHNMVAFMEQSQPLTKKLSRYKQQIFESASSMLQRQYGPQFLQMAIGRFANDLVEQLWRKTTGATSTRLALYSAHEVTLAPLQLILGVYQGYPSMGASMCFELYHQTRLGFGFGPRSSYAVRVLCERRPVLVRGHEYCPFDEFVGLLSKYALTQEQYQCICN